MAEPTPQDWQRLAHELYGRVRQLEAERDGRPIPPMSDFTEQAMSDKWVAMLERFRRLH